MKKSVINGIPIYALSSHKRNPEYLSESKRRQLQKEDDSFLRRIDLMQDFEMPTASSYIAFTPDGSHVAVAGGYPPRIKMFETAQVSMKFERYLDANAVRIAVLENDWRKLLILGDDRSVEVHAAYGKHHRVRIPKFGRDVAFHRPTAEAFIAASGSEIYRLSLEEGRFMAPLQTGSGSDDDTGVNALSICGTTGLLLAGCEDGGLEVWDPRTQRRAGRVDVAVAAPRSLAVNADRGITAVAAHDNGLQAAVGTADGRAMLFDLRSTKPLTVKDHLNDLPVHTVTFHGDERVASADAQVIRFWQADTGKTFTSIEPPVKCSHFAIAPNDRFSGAAAAAAAAVGGADGDGDPSLHRHSGLLLVAGEQEKVMSFYVPDLGVAPRWCSFLDNLLEEDEDTKATLEGAGQAGAVFDDYKFVSRDELKRLGLAHLVGTTLLKPYMHGFFIDARLHKEVQAAIDPNAHKRWEAQRVKAKLAAKEGSRILKRRRAPKVNAELAARLAGDGKGTGGAAAAAEPPLVDPRFQALFTNPAFQIDEEAAEFVRMGRIRAAGTGGAGSDDDDLQSDSEDDQDTDAERSDGDDAVAAGGDPMDATAINWQEEGNVRERLRSLMREKDSVEERLKSVIEALASMNVPAKGGLVDAQGFPRADVNVMDARKLQHSHAELQNDHKAMLEEVERGLHEMARRRSQQEPRAEPAPEGRGGGEQEGKRDPAEDEVQPAAASVPAAAAAAGAGAAGEAAAPGLPQPFARVNGVQEGTAAWAAGLREGDLLLRFGSLDSLPAGGSLQPIAQVMRSAMGSGLPLRVEVLRAAEPGEQRAAPAGTVIMQRHAAELLVPAGGGLGLHLLPM